MASVCPAVVITSQGGNGIMRKHLAMELPWVSIIPLVFTPPKAGLQSPLLGL